MPPFHCCNFEGFYSHFLFLSLFFFWSHSQHKLSAYAWFATDRNTIVAWIDLNPNRNGGDHAWHLLTSKIIIVIHLIYALFGFPYTRIPNDFFESLSFRQNENKKKNRVKKLLILAHSLALQRNERRTIPIQNLFNKIVYHLDRDYARHKQES